MAATPEDTQVLRDLATRKAELAALPCQEQTRERWRRLNGLEPDRPMVMIDQIPWHEMDTDARELELRCTDPFCRNIETQLRRELYHWDHMRVDMVIEPYVGIRKAIEGVGYGIGVMDTVSVSDPTNDVVGHAYHDQLSTEEDLEKLSMPSISLNEPLTAEREQVAHEIFDGIIDVRMLGTSIYFSPWDRLFEWRGADTMLLDLLVRPDFIHRTLEKVTAISHAILDQLVEQGLFHEEREVVHCTGAYSDELEICAEQATAPSPANSWTFGMAQIFSSVSSETHKEFETEYAKSWYERFKLGYYGCCEPLDTKVDIIRELPHVRKISMSPWVDVERGAEAIGSDFVFSRKPSPAFLAWDDMDENIVRADLQKTLDACTTHGCPVELILKDISTVRYDPQRLWRWAEIAMELVRD